MPQSSSGLMDSWVPLHTTGNPEGSLSYHMLPPTNSPDSKRKPAQQAQCHVTAQYLENPIQSLGEMGLEQNLKKPVVTSWGTAEHQKARRLWSASTARRKCWSLGLKKEQNKTKTTKEKNKQTNLVSWYPHPKIPSTDPNLRLCQFVS